MPQLPPVQSSPADGAPTVTQLVLWVVAAIAVLALVLWWVWSLDIVQSPNRVMVNAFSVTLRLPPLS